MFSFWNRPWVKKVAVTIYGVVIITSSIVFCYYTFSFDTEPKNKINTNMAVQTSCHKELLRAEKEFEKDPVPQKWKKWADLQMTCR